MVTDRTSRSVSLLADDLKQQTSQVDTTSKLITASEDWAQIYEMKWASVNYQIIMNTGPHETSLAFILNNQQVHIKSATTFLRLTDTAIGGGRKWIKTETTPGNNHGASAEEIGNKRKQLHKWRHYLQSSCINTLDGVIWFTSHSPNQWSDPKVGGDERICHRNMSRNVR